MRFGSTFQANLYTVNSKKYSSRVLNHGWGPSVPLQYTVAIYQYAPKNSGRDTGHSNWKSGMLNQSLATYKDHRKYFKNNVLYLILDIKG